MSRAVLPIAVALAASAVALADIPELDVPTGAARTALAPEKPATLEPAPADARRLPFPAAARALARDLDAWVAAHPTHRLHVALDRPLYRPGDEVALRVWDLATRGLAPTGAAVTAELVDPRGTVVERKGVTDAATFRLAEGAPGGSWTLRAVAADGATVERSFAVASFEVPRVKKTLTFARDGYGPGDAVEATVHLARATGEPLARVTATARVQADGVAGPPIAVTTDARGEAKVRFEVPSPLQAPDVILTVMVDDGGVTESISRPVPVVLDRVEVALFPEGGELVAGLPARVYFEATDPHGEPADVEGVVVDDRGGVVAALESWVDGRGHFTFTPAAGRSYRARIERPGEDPSFPLPAARDGGCVLRHHDDLEGAATAVRVSVRCSGPRDVVVLASQQEQLLDRAAVHVPAGRATTVHLRSADPALAGAQGVARVTVLDAAGLAPLAERLVFRNKGRPLEVRVAPDREGYAPGDEVVLRVRTTDPEGRPVPAELALAVVDDRLLAHADDREHHLAARVLLQADLPEPIEDVNHLFAPDAEDGGLGLDLVLGTRGWRRFDWAQVRGFEERQRAAGWAARDRDLRALGYAIDDLVGLVATRSAPVQADWPAPSVAVEAEERVAFGAPAPEADVKVEAAVRVFAPPAPRADAEPPRSDFRDTVHWEPALRTGADGVATVRFALSDAVTGFRAIAEGVGGGRIGRGEALIASTLPFHVDLRLPQELSAGDRLLLPVTLENGRDDAVEVDLAAEVSPLLAVGEGPGRVALGAGERRTVHLPLTALPGRGAAEIALHAAAGPTADAIVRELPIVPRGIPVTRALSGVLEGGRAKHLVEVPASAVEGSIRGEVVVFPSAVSELLEGVEAMVREPGGCFEQTSSTNYPNVLVLDWLERTGGGERLAADRQRVLETGYRILTGYQVESGGFETWGDGPGKEALSAYGLLQFADMRRVFDVDPRILEDNVRYLYQQRDGRGGFAVTGASAHGYGTAPPEVLDAYITFALVETGHRDLGPEIAAQAALARRTEDPYRLALATLTLLHTRPEEGRAAARRLAALQAADGSFPGSETSITRSENQNLLVEATALATIALLRAGAYEDAEAAVRWLHATRTGSGIWGATQANALALKALSEAATAFARAETDGRLTVLVDGRPAGEARFAAGAREPVTIDLGAALSPGRHTVEIALDGGGALPWALELGWSSETPPSDPSRRVELAVALADDHLAVGETTRLTATVTNRTREIVPDPIARIGLPAGLSAQAWQLGQLVDRGEIAYFETRPREVTLYWDGIAADEVHEVALDLVAEVPGTFAAPASAAYPYYDDQARAWVAGAEVTIAP